MRRLIVWGLALSSWQGMAYSDATQQRAIAHDRMQETEVKETLLQGLMTLADLRITDHPGRHNPIYDSCSTGDGCRSVFPLADPRITFGLPTPPFWPKIKNYPNEWSSSIHALTQFVKTPDGQAPLLIPDSNMFVTASMMYPLTFVKDLPQGPFAAMSQGALEAIRAYKRNGAYSFWRNHDSDVTGIQVIGPANIPVKILSLLANIQKALSGKSSPKNPHDKDGSGPQMRPGWVQAIGDKSINPVGLETFFNIPSDADDTALAMISFGLLQADEPGELDGLAKILLQHRDINRSFEDGRDSWKGKNSRAFLTWLKDESLPIESAFDPAVGVIPFGINNVDCVVNANVVFALGLAGYSQHKATQDALTALNRAVELDAWPKCGLYYPHKMMLPYTLTRAYRDGGLSHPGMEQTFHRLLLRLLADQKETAQRHPRHKGAFSGGLDKTYDLATALALNALLNIGRELPTELGLLDDYQRAVEQGIGYLLQHKMLTKVHFQENLGELAQGESKEAMWKPGIFFSASIQEAAQWRSEAYTTAIVVEALVKYLLAWDHGRDPVRAADTLQFTNGELQLESLSGT